MPILRVFCLALCVGVLWQRASATETENLGLKVMPAPGAVQVDGKFSDWDLTGGILVCGDVETARDTVSLWFHAMHDAENLYVLARWNDETPVNNPGVTAGDAGWQGDGLQFRLIVGYNQPDERVSHFTCWKGRDGNDVIDVSYGRDLKQGRVRNLKANGGQQAFAIDGDKLGYVQEIAIPWTAVAPGGRVPQAGEAFRLTIEPNFTIGATGRASYKDCFQPGMILDRIFTFRAYKQWGSATLEARGGQQPRPVRLTDGREFAVTIEAGLPTVDWTGLIQSRALVGFKPITITMPENGFVSLNICNDEGEVVRQLLNCEFVTKGEHTFEWDGLSTSSFRTPGEPVAAGTYSWQAIHHTGIGLRLKGWACNSGITPWDFPPGRGNWGGDHGAPSAVAVDDKHVYLGWSGAEAGKALLACNFDGDVQWNNTNGGIGGALAVAVDGDTVYALNYKHIYRVHRKNGIYTPWKGSEGAELPMAQIFPGYKHSKSQHMTFAAGGGSLFLSSREHNEVTALDGSTGAILKRWSILQPLQLAYRPGGQLLIVTSEALLALDPEGENPTPLISGLVNARAVAVDAEGNLFVAVGDPDNQIQVYSPGGKLLRSIGRPGGRELVGKWTPDGVRFVHAMAVDKQNQLWVVEHDMGPKRISVWNAATGELVRELFGPAQYGATGGAINPQDPSLMVGQGCEWRLDPDSGKAACVGVITRRPMGISRFAEGPDGRLYLFVGHGWLHGPHPLDIYLRRGDADYQLVATFRYAGSNRATYSTTYWADENGDGEVQPQEETTVPQRFAFGGWYLGVTPDLSLYTMSGDPFQIQLDGFTECGAPQYNLRNPRPLPMLGLGSSDARSLFSWAPNGEDFGWCRGHDLQTGKLRWRYPNNFAGVHGSHKAPPPEVGLIRGAYPPCGTAKLPEPIGNVWFLPTNLGEWHVLTERGFYLTRLFLQGDSLQIQWPEVAVPGAVLDNVPPGMGGEDFGGSVTLAHDGKVYIQAGKTAFWNVEVVGLESVKELPGGSLSISDADTALAQQLREKQLQTRAERQELIVKRLTPTFTGKPQTDFAGATFVKFQKQDEAAVQGAAAWDDENLYLVWDVSDATPWVNGANQSEMMYLHGDTVDFQLGTDPSADSKRKEAVLGDLRISIGNFHGEPRAVMYRRVARDPRPRTFSSGVIQDYKMESVTTLERAKIHAQILGRNRYVVEAAIPLSELELRPQAGLALRGDIGVTHGDVAGQRTRLRTYWTNQHTGIVDDAVFELQMEPQYWGKIQFE